MYYLVTYVLFFLGSSTNTDSDDNKLIFPLTVAITFVVTAILTVVLTLLIVYIIYRMKQRAQVAKGQASVVTTAISMPKDSTIKTTTNGSSDAEYELPDNYVPAKSTATYDNSQLRNTPTNNYTSNYDNSRLTKLQANPAYSSV